MQAESSPRPSEMSIHRASVSSCCLGLQAEMAEMDQWNRPATINSERRDPRVKAIPHEQRQVIRHGRGAILADVTGRQVGRNSDRDKGRCISILVRMTAQRPCH